MMASGWARIALVMACAGLSLWWGSKIRAAKGGTVAMVDFGGIYYEARSAIQHLDPYNPDVVRKEFKAEGGQFPTDPLAAKADPIVVTVGVNLPTALFLAVPVAMLPWGVAQTLWILITAGLLAMAGYLMWSMGVNAAPILSACAVGFTLLNSEVLLGVGNVAGIAVSLCMIATWCFLKERYIAVAVVLLAVSLALKPHDAGFIWLYFLLAGGVMRKRALQTLAVVAILGVLAMIWIAPASPHWIQELHQNHIAVAQRGGTSDPGLTGLTNENLIMRVIDLQAVLSVFRNEPNFYNLGSFLIVVPLIVTWAILVLRKPSSPERDRLALAAIACLSLLPIYHRPYDAKLLMLTIPAFAILWAQGGLQKWLAFAITSSGLLLTSDISLIVLSHFTNRLSIPTFTFVDKMVAACQLEPTPIILLAMGCFYLWVYARYPSSPVLEQVDKCSELDLVAPASY